jgi:hypothetical protein
MLKITAILSTIVVAITLQSGRPFSYNHPASIVNPCSDSLVDLWRSDSLGCMRLRNYEMGVKLAIKYTLKRKSVGDIIALLGQPNKTIHYKDKGVILRYFYNTCCRDGKLDLECDFAWLDFNFSDSANNSSKIEGGIL